MPRETGLYYLQSRYYNPQWGRFINADGQIFANTPLGLNLFVYCLNNPVNYFDPTGEITIPTIILIVSAVLAVAAAGYVAYVEYEAGFPTEQIILDSVSTGLFVFSIAYTAGMSIYQVYQNFCYIHGLTPVTGINIHTSQPYYPPNDGFAGTPVKTTLEPGTLIQRTGPLSGRYVAPAGTPLETLSLPPDKIGQPTTILQVQQPTEVLSGTTAPWFGQVGGGIQYILQDGPVDQLIERGILTIWGG